MKVIDPGHKYKLDYIDKQTTEILEGSLTFVKRFRGEANHTGTTCQEVLRVLIDRVQFLDKEIPWEGNKDLLKHLRMALILFEARALIRKVEKDELLPEQVMISKVDGHFSLTYLIENAPISVYMEDEND